MTGVEWPAGPVFRARDILVVAGALALFALTVGLVLLSAGSTLGYDFDAYIEAARRLTSGLPLYDQSVSVAGGHAIFLYPPPFAVAMMPLLVLPEAVARTGWSLAMAACVPVGAGLLPVKRDVRLLVIILAALDWPLLYAVKLGQVGPLLFLVFAIAWRSLDRTLPLAASVALGALVKVQPGLLALWAVATRRYRVAAAALGLGVAAVLGVTVVMGPGVWFDYLGLLGRVSSTAAVPRNTSPAAIALDLGLSASASGIVQAGVTLLVAAATLVSWRILGSDASLLVTVLASQLVTPLLWDHYAVVLLLPTAWLLQRGRYWGVVFPLAGWLALPIGEPGGSAFAAATVPLAFLGCLAALLWVGRREISGPAAPARTSVA
jgi:alpha-1,2-mannosyltransferase